MLMNKDLLLDGKNFISAKDASEKFGYTQDYVGQLVRSGRIEGKLIGRTWYVNTEALSGHRKNKKFRKKETEAEAVESPALPKDLANYESEPVLILPRLLAKSPIKLWGLRKAVIKDAVVAGVSL